MAKTTTRSRKIAPKTTVKSTTKKEQTRQTWDPWALMRMVGRRWLIAASALIVYGLIYLTGLTKHEGYLEAFGVDPHAFPQPASEYFTLAFAAYLEQFVKVIGNQQNFFTLIGVVAAAGTIVALIMVPLLEYTDKRSKTLELNEMLRMAQGRERSPLYRFRAWVLSWDPLWLKIPCVVGSCTVIIWTLVPTIISFFIMLGCWPTFQGQEDARNEKRTFYQCKGERYVRGELCAYLLDRDKNVVASGIQVATSEANIAIYDGHGSYVFKRDGLTVFVPLKNSPK